METAERLLSIQEVMAATSLSRMTIYRLVKRGDLRPMRASEWPSSKYLFPDTELKRWIEARLAARSQPPQGAGW